jgi:predicted nucleic acid-binding protein
VYLIDTSVWIDSLRGVDNGPVRFFKSLIAERAHYGLTGIIYQEVLQGAGGARVSINCAPTWRL